MITLITTQIEDLFIYYDTLKYLVLFLVHLTSGMLVIFQIDLQELFLYYRIAFAY